MTSYDADSGSIQPSTYHSSILHNSLMLMPVSLVIIAVLAIISVVI